MDFNKLSREKQEAIVILEIIRCLNNLGGTANRQQLIRELRETSDLIPEEFWDFEKIGKNKKLYKPANFHFQFAVKNLEMAQYLIRPKRGIYQLTELGLKADLDNQFGEKIQLLARPLWEDKKKINRKNKTASETFDDSFIELEVEDTWKLKLHQALVNMHPQKFEKFCRLLVKEMGVKLDEKIGKNYVADGGLDGFGYITGQDDFRTNRVAIQAKRWQANIQSPEIDKFRGAMDKYNAEYGIFITTSKFSRGAREASRVGTRVITLIDGDDIADLVAKYQLHVTEIKTYELNDFYKN